MAGRDSLPHFPAPEKAQRPSQSQGNMYQQPYQQQQQQGYQGQAPPPSAVPGGYPPPGSPVGGYQVGPPPGSGYPPPQQQGGFQQGGGYGGGFNQGQRPPTSQPPPGVDPQLYSLFRAADVNGSGQLSEKELGHALVNGDWTPFDARTIKLMVKMFDVDQYVRILFLALITAPEQSACKSLSVCGVI